jgi:hypothetical protein
MTSLITNAIIRWEGFDLGLEIRGRPRPSPTPEVAEYSGDTSTADGDIALSLVAGAR